MIQGATCRGGGVLWRPCYRPQSLLQIDYISSLRGDALCGYRLSFFYINLWTL